MRAFSDSVSDMVSDISDADMEEEERRAKELGAAAPAEDSSKRQRERDREKQKEMWRYQREEKRKRAEADIRETEDDADVREMLSGERESLLTAEDFHKVLLIQDSQIRQLKQDREESNKMHRQQAETNTVFSKVITAQISSQKKS